MTFGRPLRVKAVAVIAIAVLGLAACGSSKKTTTNTTTSSGTAAGGGGATLKLGFFGALTGPNAQLGINILDGEKLAVQQYNATATTKVSVDPFDSQGDPANANNGATKLIGDHVVAVIGPAFSGESAAADGSFETAGIPNITASATNIHLALHGYKFFHRALADDNYQGQGDADYLTKVLHLTKIAVVDDNTTYGLGLANKVRSALAASGATVVVNDHVDPNGTDYGSTVNKVTSSGATAIFYGGYYANAGTLLKQLRAAGFKGTFMSGDGSEDIHLVADAGGAANANGAFLSCACADETQNPAAAAFVTAYKAAFNMAPAIYSAEAYDATQFVLQAIKSGATTPAAINTYLASNSYTGLTKTLKFQANGNVDSKTIYMYEIKNGQLVEIGTTT